MNGWFSRQYHTLRVWYFWWFRNPAKKNSWYVQNILIYKVLALYQVVFLTGFLNHQCCISSYLLVFFKKCLPIIQTLLSFCCHPNLNTLRVWYHQQFLPIQNGWEFLFNHPIPRLDPTIRRCCGITDLAQGGGWWWWKKLMFSGWWF